MDELKMLVVKLRQHLNNKQASLVAGGGYNTELNKKLQHIENQITGFEDAVDKHVRSGDAGNVFIMRIMKEGFLKDADKIHAAIDKAGTAAMGS